MHVLPGRSKCVQGLLPRCAAGVDQGEAKQKQRQKLRIIKRPGDGVSVEAVFGRL